MKTKHKLWTSALLGFTFLLSPFSVSAAATIPAASKIAVPSTVSGIDSRKQVADTTVFPYSAIAFLKIRFPSGNWFNGTGFMIAPNKVLTAGHCVYDKSEGGWATSIIVTPGTNNALSAPFGSYVASSKDLSAASEWVNSTDSDVKNSYEIYNDIGEITLSSNVGYRTGVFKISTNVSIGQTITVTGYPGDRGYMTQFTGSGQLIYFDNDIYDYDVDTYSGQSGSPVLNSQNQAIGVNVAQDNVPNGTEYAWNYGVRFYGNKLQFVKQFLNYTPFSSIYRVYNPNSSEHFYTTYVGEKDNLVAHGWQYEGIEWAAPSSNAKPIYRLYNVNGGEHFYTMSSYERDSLVRVGWRYEQIAFYDASSSNGAAVYRVYNPNSGQHFYTIKAYERDSLVRLGWKDEGIAWYRLK